ncbi:MAG: branched-chain amino acid transaminase [Ruminobacter sp.]|jgi:branched-chain amino acid aminotransferase|uniref:branched-chain amino acid transaminase n=1 Tax=Ruminobacter sp. TaxID=2774296 RepID=UPI001B2DAF0F|nr:branched-chain amino acid transaminase [Ruminobacter sp.]MBO6010040.1 branched-chain amino acid transaminase [Ruminobacter sp.]MBP3749643.1 branched-chain amino acid transaminase [Ruminobacter sp.]
MSVKATTKYIWFNGEMVPWADAKVHVMTHALHYGTSVFEGLRFYKTPNGTIIFRLREHMQRLLNSAHIYRINIPYTLDELCEACCKTVRENGLESGYIRPLAFIGDVGLGVKPPADAKIEVIIGVVPWGAYLGEEGMKKGVAVGVSSWNRLAPNTIPTGAKAGGNYLSSLLISNEAKQNGYTEGIALDVQGFLAEGSGENVFLIKDGVIYTAPITCSLLPGITRDCVMKLAKELGIEVREERIPREALYLADEVFMTGSAAEITPVSSVDGLAVGCGARGPITEKLQNAFFGLFNGQTEDKWNWLYPVNK